MKVEFGKICHLAQFLHAQIIVQVLVDVIKNLIKSIRIVLLPGFVHRTPLVRIILPLHREYVLTNIAFLRIKLTQLHAISCQRRLSAIVEISVLNQVAGQVKHTTVVCR